MNSTIAIIIPVYNALSYTIKCLNTIFGLINKPELEPFFNVIVVDDGSTDGTAGWIKENYPHTIILEGDGNLWWSGGMNKGTRYALETLGSKYVLWWNNDIIPKENYFANLLSIVRRDQILVGGSKIYYFDQPQVVWSMGGIFETRSGKKYMIGMNEADNPSFQKKISVDWLPGMGTFIHKSVFEKIGFIDEKNFPQYHGDSDFTFRAKLAGYEIVVFPELKIWNDKSNSGLMHQSSFKKLVRTLHDIKSNYHIKKDVQFYKRYATSSMAYQTLAHKYCYYIGGFFKWKLLNLFGLSKKESL